MKGKPEGPRPVPIKQQGRRQRQEIKSRNKLLGGFILL